MADVLTPTQLERGVTLAERERATRWEWGDWALDVVGPVGEMGHSNGRTALLRQALSELAKKGSLLCDDMPSETQLRDYRYAADAIPSALRDRVRSIEVGRKLASIKDVRERHALIERLSSEHEHGIVSEHALREALGNAPVGPRASQDVTPAKIVEALQDPDVRAAVVATNDPSVAELVTEVAESHEQRVSVVGAGPEQYELDRPLFRAASALHVARTLMDANGVQSVVDVAQLHEALDQMADDVAVLVAGVAEEMKASRS